LRRAALGVIVLATLPYQLPAQEVEVDASRRYRMLRLSDATTVIKRVNDVAADGYRVRGLVPDASGAADEGHAHLKRNAGAVVLLEKTGNPLDNYQYRQIVGGGKDSLEPRLNEAGSAGFRLMARDVALAWGVPLEFNVLWMEKEPGPVKQFEYRVIEMGMKMLLGASLKPKYWFETDPVKYVRPVLERHYAEGFRIVLMISGSIAVMERPLDAQFQPEPVADGGPQAAEKSPRYRSLRYFKPDKLQRELAKAAQNQYRMVDFDATPPPLEPAVILEKSSTPIAIPEYFAVEGKGLSATEKLLNEAAGRGFRLLPRSIRFGGQEWSLYRQTPDEKTQIRALLVKTGEATPTYEYQLVAHARPDALFDQMRALVNEGYRLSALLSAQLLVMERSSAAGKEPQP
jgi:hypothetical protein